MLIFIALTSASLFISYIFTYRFFSSRLPTSQSTPPSSVRLSVSRSEAYYLFVAIVVALLFRIPGITRGLAYDELFAAIFYVEVDSLWATISRYSAFSNHIAYSLLEQLSRTLFGRHEWALRLPALILGLGGLYFLWLFARELLGPRLALVATFVLALSPVHIGWSQTARGYSGMILFTLASTYFYFGLLRHSSRSHACKFILVSVIGIYFHLYAAFVTIAQILFVLYLGTKQIRSRTPTRLLSVSSFRTLWYSFAVIIGLSLVCYSPVLPQLIANLTELERERLRPLFPLKVIRMLSGDISPPLVALVFLSVLIGLLSLSRSHPNEATFLIFLFVIPLLPSWLATPHYLRERFFAFFLPYYVVLLVSGFFTMWHYAFAQRNKIGHYSLRALYVLLAVSVMYSWVARPWSKLPQSGFREAVKAMERVSIQSVGLCAVGSGRWGYQYYAQGKIFVPRSMEEFQRFVANYPEVRCAYREGRVLAEQREIVDFLREKAQSAEQFDYITVFTYSK